MNDQAESTEYAEAANARIDDVLAKHRERANDAGDSLPINEIVCGDNVAVMETFPNDSIDLVVTSPPYDDLRTYGGHSWDFEGVAQQLWRIVKLGGVVVWITNDKTENGGESLCSFRQALAFDEIGFSVETMIYGKNGSPDPNQDNHRYLQSFEYMFCLVKGQKSATFNPITSQNIWAGSKRAPSAKMQRNGVARTYGKSASGKTHEKSKLPNIWVYPTGWNLTSKDASAFQHPAPFPEQLAHDHIISWSNENDIVLDPFNGSGTTTKMARLAGRRFIGIEVNPDYCEIAQKRLSEGLLPFMEPSEDVPTG